MDGLGCFSGLGSFFRMSLSKVFCLLEALWLVFTYLSPPPPVLPRMLVILRLNVCSERNIISTRSWCQMVMIYILLAGVLLVNCMWECLLIFLRSLATLPRMQVPVWGYGRACVYLYTVHDVGVPCAFTCSYFEQKKIF